MLCKGTMKQTTVLQSWPRSDHEAAQREGYAGSDPETIDCAVHSKTHISKYIYMTKHIQHTWNMFNNKFIELDGRFKWRAVAANLTNYASVTIVKRRILLPGTWICKERRLRRLLTKRCEVSKTTKHSASESQYLCGRPRFMYNLYDLSLEGAQLERPFSTWSTHVYLRRGSASRCTISHKLSITRTLRWLLGIPDVLSFLRVRHTAVAML